MLHVLIIVAGGLVEVLTEKAEKHVGKRRLPEEKHGKYRWIKTLIRRNSEDIREVKRILTRLCYGLRHLMDFEAEYLVEMVCRDSRDEVILEVLRAAGSSGISPKEIHAQVRKFGLKYHHISRRISRMNKRMQTEIGEQVAEKVGRNWALSSFMDRNWTAQKGEITPEDDSEMEVSV